MARRHTATSRRVRRLTISTLAATTAASMAAAAVMAGHHDDAAVAVTPVVTTNSESTAVPETIEPSSVSAADSTVTPDATTRAS